MGKAFGLWELRPQLNISGDECDAKQIIDIQLSMLCRLTQDYEASLVLFDETETISLEKYQTLMENVRSPDALSEPQLAARSRIFEDLQQSQNCRLIAVRQGALTLNHYSIALSAIKTMLQQDSHFRLTECSPGVFEKAHRRFHTYFKHVKKVRDSIAHTTEMIKNPIELQKHSTHGSGNWFFDNLEGRRFITTAHQGAEVSYDLDSHSLDELIGITKLVFSAFQKRKDVPQFSKA